jgi:translocation and assembly module TamB
LRTAAKWLGIAIGTVLLLIAALYFGINTELGRRYVAKQIDSLEMASGARYRHRSSRRLDLRQADHPRSDAEGPEGNLLLGAEAELDWRPFSYFRTISTSRS